MLKEGLDGYLPLVDDDVVDALVRKPNGTSALVQIKARSRDVIPGDAPLFAAIDHPAEREHYSFVFSSERMDAMWIITSGEFIENSHRNRSGKNVGRLTIWFNGRRDDKTIGQRDEYTKPKFKKYVATDSRRIRDGV